MERSTSQAALSKAIAVSIIGIAASLIGGITWGIHHRQVAFTAPPIPPQTLPTPNAYDTYVKAGSLLSNKNDISNSYFAIVGSSQTNKPSIADLAKGRKLVADNHDAIALLRTGFRYQCVSPRSKSVDSQMYPFQLLNQLLRIDGAIHESTGDWCGAASSYLDEIRFGTDVSHGATQLLFPMIMNWELAGQRPLWRLIPHLTASQARACAARLSAIDAMHEPFVNVMQQEEWLGQEHLRAEFAKPDWPQALTNDIAKDYGILNPSSDTTLSLFRAGVSFIGKRHLYDAYTQYREQFIVSAKSPYAAKVPTNRVKVDPMSALICVVADEDPYDSFRLRDALTQTRNRLLIVSLCLQAYHRDRRHYPSRLTDLPATDLHTVADDPFALHSLLKYKRTNSGYLLYSVGPDGKDDHGTPIPKKQRITDYSTGDIVADADHP